MTPDGIRIGFLSHEDPLSYRSWSGALCQMYRALEATGFQVIHIGASVPDTRTRLSRFEEKLLRRLGWNRLRAAQFRRLVKTYAAKMQSQLEYMPCDVIFAPRGSLFLSHIRTKLPIIYLSDSTARLSLGYYNNTPYSRRANEYYELCEAQALARADRIVYFGGSRAADSAVRDYGVDPAKIRIIGAGGNVTVPADIDSILSRKQCEQCRLLFIGIDWERKGGDVAIETLDALARAGIDAMLTVCSAKVPTAVRKHEGVRFEGFLNKDNPAEAERYHELLCEAHFILVPSRADNGSFAALEANAYGVPAVVRSTGGLVTLIADGTNGISVPDAADARDFAEAILQIWNDRCAYQSLVASTRAHYESRPQWSGWGERMTDLVLELVNRRA